MALTSSVSKEKEPQFVLIPSKNDDGDGAEFVVVRIDDDDDDEEDKKPTKNKLVNKTQSTPQLDLELEIRKALGLSTKETKNSSDAEDDLKKMPPTSGKTKPGATNISALCDLEQEIMKEMGLKSAKKKRAVPRTESNSVPLANEAKDDESIAVGTEVKRDESATVTSSSLCRRGFPPRIALDSAASAASSAATAASLDSQAAPRNNRGFQSSRIRKFSITRPDYVRPVGNRLRPPEPEDFKCPICNERFSKDFYLEAHLKQHEFYEKAVKEDPDDGIKRENGENPEANIIALVGSYNAYAGRGLFKCGCCGKLFRNIGHIHAHLEDYHELPQSALVATKRAHEEKDPVSGELVRFCVECEAPFKEEEALVKHYYTHMNTPFKCSFCDRGFWQNTELQRHNIRFHRKPSSLMPATTMAPNDWRKRKATVDTTTASSASSGVKRLVTSGGESNLVELKIEPVVVDEEIERRSIVDRGKKKNS